MKKIVRGLRELLLRAGVDKDLALRKKAFVLPAGTILGRRKSRVLYCVTKLLQTEPKIGILG